MVDKQIVLRFLGYGKKSPPKIIERKLDEELNKYEEYLEREYYMKCVEVDGLKKDTVIFGGDISIESSYLYKKLKDVNKAYVAVYTVGKKIEKVIEDYSNQTEMIRAMIVDKIGVVALDELRDQLIADIESKEYPKFISSIAYPSQGDFEVENQKKLFKLFKHEPMNIEINEGSQFSPLKTVLLVYGIGDVKHVGSMCEDCEDRCSASQFSEN